MVLRPIYTIILVIGDTGYLFFFSRKGQDIFDESITLRYHLSNSNYSQNENLFFFFSEWPKNKDINRSMNDAASKCSELAHNQDPKKKKGPHILLSFCKMQQNMHVSRIGIKN